MTSVLKLFLATALLYSPFASAEDVIPPEGQACYRCEAAGINGQHGEYTSTQLNLATRGALFACEENRGIACRVRQCMREPLEVCGVGRPRAYRCEAAGFTRGGRQVFADDTDNNASMAARMAVLKCEREGGVNCRVLHCERL